jgi:hypothetical protein
MKLTGAGDPKLETENIYAIIGKKPFLPTSLADLQAAAVRLGFTASGYSCGLAELAKIKDYMILPVGTAKGTSEDPVHFVLATEVSENYAAVVDTRTLKIFAIRTSELAKDWNGEVLVISAGKDMAPLRRISSEELTKQDSPSDSRYDDLKDFGNVSCGTVLRHVFIVRGASNQRARICGKSCSCLRATIERNESGESILIVEVSVERAGLKQAIVAVECEPGGKVRYYGVRARGVDAFAVYPRHVYIAQPLGEPAERTITFDYFTDTRGTVTFESFQTDIPGLMSGRIRTTESVSEGTRVIHIAIPLSMERSDESTSVKHLAGTAQFSFQTEKGRRTETIQVAVDVGHDPYKITPARIFMIASKSGAAVSRNLEVVFPMEEPRSTLDISAGGDLPVKVVVAHVLPGTYTASITCTSQGIERLPLGLSSGVLHICYQRAAQSIDVNVPLEIFVRE